MKRFVVLAGLCLIACSGARPEDTNKSLVAPSTDPSSTHENVRLTSNSQSQAEIDAFVSELDATAVEVLLNGAPIYSYGDVSRTDGLYVASVRKSLLALLYGPWVENGTIDLEATMGDLNFDDIEGLSLHEKHATIRAAKRKLWNLRDRAFVISFELGRVDTIFRDWNLLIFLGCEPNTAC